MTEDHASQRRALVPAARPQRPRPSAIPTKRAPSDASKKPRAVSRPSGAATRRRFAHVGLYMVAQKSAQNGVLQAAHRWRRGARASSPLYTVYFIKCTVGGGAPKPALDVRLLGTEEAAHHHIEFSRLKNRRIVESLVSELLDRYLKSCRFGPSGFKLNLTEGPETLYGGRDRGKKISSENVYCLLALALTGVGNLDRDMNFIVLAKGR